MKKILYIMHVDWRWIKQRPHFIAEGLSEKFDVTVVHFCSKNYLFKNYDKFNNNLKILPAIRLPLYQNRVIYALNKIYLKLYFKFLIKKYNPDFIWLTFPQMYDYLPENVDCNLIYDCMDLATGFDFNDNFKSNILHLEERLVCDASLIFTSSNYLFKKLNENYQCKEKLINIRNAFGGAIIKENYVIKHKKPYKICYVGTISKWIDFPILEKSLEQIEDIEYHFIGPSELKNKINNRKFKFHGIIEYENLYDFVENFDCLIVPFKIDEKIKAADPGKIYDYINYNKPIISIFYEELENFSEFLYFYNSSEEFLDCLNNIITKEFKRKYSSKKRLEFLLKNSWDFRVQEIVSYLENIK